MLLARHLYRKTPRTVSEVCNIAGVVMAVLILLAPNPRVGYLLYPINFFVWAYLLAEPAQESDLLPDVSAAPGRAVRRRPLSSPRAPRPIYWESPTCRIRRVKSVSPRGGPPGRKAVGAITAPISQ